VAGFEMAGSAAWEVAGEACTEVVDWTTGAETTEVEGAPWLAASLVGSAWVDWAALLVITLEAAMLDGTALVVALPVMTLDVAVEVATEVALAVRLAVAVALAVTLAVAVALAVILAVSVAVAVATGKVVAVALTG
jgi:hypothetical protein